jgi:hypothetical protein
MIYNQNVTGNTHSIFANKDLFEEICGPSIFFWFFSFGFPFVFSVGGQ